MGSPGLCRVGDVAETGTRSIPAERAFGLRHAEFQVMNGRPGTGPQSSRARPGLKTVIWQL